MRAPSRNPGRTLPILLGIIALAGLGACTDPGPTPAPNSVPPPAPAADGAADGGASPPAPGGPSGEAVYEATKCSRCHTIGEPGVKKLGGALDGVGSRRDATWLREYLLDPKSKVDEARMPAVELPEAELEALIAYLLSLK